MKNSPHHRWYVALLGLALSTLIIAGCASTQPPTGQISNTKMAVSKAVNAGGNELAPMEMRAAQRKLGLAVNAMDEERYESARLFAEQAEVDAQLAESIARSTRAQEAATVVQEDNRVLREEIDRQ